MPGCRVVSKEDQVGKGRAKRPKPAVSRSTEAADLTQRLLRHYAADPEFQQALRQFAERNEDVIRRLAEAEEQSTGLSALDKLALWRAFWPLIEEYHADTEAFTRKWGLELLPDQLGKESLHRFCLDRFRTGLNFEALPRAVTDIDDFNRVVSEEFGQPGVRFVGEFHFWGEWAASQETRAQARDRLIAEFIAMIDGELERIVQEFEQIGYAFRDHEPKLDEHLKWLYRRLAHREHCEDIAEHFEKNAHFLRRETDVLATRMNITLPPSMRRPFRRYDPDRRLP
jgi:hypothetical protein